MAWPWFVPCSLLQSPSVERIDETLTVTWHRKTVDLETQVATFSDGVEVRYGPTTIHAKTLELHLAEGERWGEAKGDVVLVDPDGTANADSLHFDWKNKTGEAANIEMRVLDLSVRAKKLVISPTRWELIDAEGTPCEGPNAPVRLRSPRVVIEPGRRGVLYRPRISVFGANLPTFPRATFSLDRRATGLNPPSISQRPGEGVGVTWSSTFLIGESSAVTGSLSSFKTRLPSYGLAFAQSTVPPESGSKLTTSSDLDERFRGDYFENVTVLTPQQGQARLHQPRNTWSVGSYWNKSPVARRPGGTFDKPLEFAWDVGLQARNWDATVSTRLQKIAEDGGNQVTRFATSLAAGPKPWSLGPGFEGVFRVDTSLFGSNVRTYGWGRALVGVVAHPANGLTVGVAYSDSVEVGTPDFEADRLLIPRGVHLRADLTLGPRKLSYLTKWDPSTRTWIDRQYSASQVMGCFEAFVVFRDIPSEYRFGLRMRIDRLVEALQNRKVRRTNQE
ncbi:MAG: hypothetical protein M9921_08815 [Fimbriimonadaceae bacterium]|nr:LPS-assembly protein LptD [Chthonomonadaceae bacterium]MCO5296945.1 hypothetical protein [Fimbriimonadaceae bacterium]